MMAFGMVSEFCLKAGSAIPPLRQKVRTVVNTELSFGSMQVLLEILSDAGQVMLHRDAGLPQVIGRADPRQH